MLGTVGKSVSIEADAPSRAEMNAAIAAAVANVSASGAPSKNAYPTLWRLIREIPANIVKLAAQTGNGLVTRLVSGDYALRTITAGTAIAVTNGNGNAGNPTVALNALLDDLLDVDVPAPNEGDVLTFDGTTDLWVAEPASSVAGTDLVYAQTRVATGDTVANTAVQTTFTDKYTVLANSISVEGGTIEARYYGVVSTDASVGPTLRWRLKLGSTVILDSGAITLPTAMANMGWMLEAAIVSNSATDNVEVQGQLRIGGQAIVALSNTADIGVTLSSDQLLQMSVQWGTADADNTITLRLMTIRLALAPEVSPVPGGGDPYFAFVKALLHFNGSNGSTTFTDEIGHTFITNIAGPTISTAQAQWFESLRLGGTGIVRSNASEPDFGLGTGDYTIEMWLRFDSVGGTQFIYDMRPLAAGSGPIIAYFGGAWQIYLNGGFNIAGGSAVINTWYHVALARDSSTTRFFVNGVQVGSNFTDAHNYGASQYIVLGAPADALGALQFVGYMDDVRLTVGVARYTAAFTPPAAQFEDF